MALEGLTASVLEALVGPHILEVPCHMERVRAAMLVTEAVVAVVPSTTVDEIELSGHMFTCVFNVLPTSTIKQMFVHTVRSRSTGVSPVPFPQGNGTYFLVN